ncbi:Asp23/Gls24 family envelope stress response protein [Kallipyga massiliensis]|uniref:Asp23/Gls24 family envelope stress response protein n=1 Tax=Kallipyga massiliensis TaxID=1472764 RepID=UPI0004B862EB|nr:Asp23/Gls24 family envelope stress response protein [Kallipyga massiliensis]
MKEFVGGSCYVANEVIDTVIAQAAAKVEGVSQVRGYDAKNGRLKSHYDKLIQTESKDGHLITALTLSVSRDAVIKDVVYQAQVAIKEEVESMFGLVCDRVDVVVI